MELFIGYLKTFQLEMGGAYGEESLQVMGGGSCRKCTSACNGGSDFGVCILVE